MRNIALFVVDVWLELKTLTAKEKKGTLKEQFFVSFTSP
jgi:hypothetical protein